MRIKKANYPTLYEGCRKIEGLGVGVLKDAKYCKVLEQRNGAFTLEMEYRREGAKSEFLKTGLIIRANASKKLRKQLFRIFHIEKDNVGNIKVYAEHITGDLFRDVVTKVKFDSTTCSNALHSVLNNTASNNKRFTGHSDIEGTCPVNYIAKPVWECIVGSEGSLIDIFGNGADIKRDNFNISILANRGQDRGVLIAYKKNIKGFTCTDNSETLVTGILPFAEKRNENTSVDENATTEPLITVGNLVKSPDYAKFDNPFIEPVDFSGDKFWDNYEVNVTNLNILARNYFKEHSEKYKLRVSYDIDLIALSETEQYKDMSFLEEIDLCDTVTVHHSLYNITDKVKVTELEFDVLNDKVIRVGLGDSVNYITSAESEINSIKKDLEKKKSELEQVIKYTTNAITGNDGGFVKLYPAHNPSEIFIMDKEDPKEATKVLRINKEGIGFGKNINGPFETAWTSDGVFNAKWIQAGTLSADRVKTGQLKNRNESLIIDLDGNSVALFSSYSGLMKKAIEFLGSQILFFDWMGANEEVARMFVGRRKGLGVGGGYGQYGNVMWGHGVNSFLDVGYKRNDGSGLYDSYMVFDAYGRDGRAFPITVLKNMKIAGDLAVTGVRIQDLATAVLYHSTSGYTVLRSSSSGLMLTNPNNEVILYLHPDKTIRTSTGAFYYNTIFNYNGDVKAYAGSDSSFIASGNGGVVLSSGGYNKFEARQNINVSWNDLDMKGRAILNQKAVNTYTNAKTRSLYQTYSAQTLQEELSYTFESTTKGKELRINLNKDISNITKDDYMIQLTAYDDCRIWCKKYDGYFIIHTDKDNIEFSCRVIKRISNEAVAMMTNFDNNETEMQIEENKDLSTEASGLIEENVTCKYDE